MNNNDTQGVDLTPYITAIMERFKPATALTEATHQLTTNEIAEAIREINPGINLTTTLTTTQVYDALIASGFTFHPAKGTQSLRFLWLLTEK